MLLGESKGNIGKERINFLGAYLGPSQTSMTELLYESS